MSRAAGVIYNLGIDRSPLGSHHTRDRQAVPYKARYRHRSEKLPLVLLEALVEKLLEQIAEELMP